MQTHMDFSQVRLETPCGAFGLTAAGGRITALSFSPPERERIFPADAEVLREAARQIAAYFAGERKGFALPLALPEKRFYSRVWEALAAIPYGETVSYSELAAAAGSPKAVRAAGMACHLNPIPILIPCHRVVGKNGSLTGYAGGIELKRALLKLEGVVV